MKWIHGRKVTIEQVIDAYQTEMESFKNDSRRVPARDNSPEAIEEYAVELWRREYSTVLHPYIIDQYRTEENQRARKEAQDELDAMRMEAVAKTRNNEL